MTTVRSVSARPNETPQIVTLRAHTFGADVVEASGGTDSAPGPHDYFDTALATCKALTALWFAKHKGLPLERVESTVESDNSEERKGTYKLKVRVELFGPLSEDQKKQIQHAIAACPIHKLMTTVDVQIENLP